MSNEAAELEADAYTLGVRETGWDLLFDWRGAERKCTVFDRGGNRVYDCEMRNDTTKPGQYGHEGPCPPGDYVLAPAHFVETDAMGAYFIPVLDLDEEGPLHKEGRAGIGIHGGGTGLEEPHAAEQGWVRTHGCFRVQNRDLDHLARILYDCHAKAGHALMHVTPG